MGKGALRHERPHHRGVKVYVINDDGAKRIIHFGLGLVARKGVDVNAFLLGTGTGPEERCVRAPDLYSAGELFLPMDELPSGLLYLRLTDPTRLANASDRIADGCQIVPEGSAAAGAKVTSMTVQTEPVAIQVRFATVRASDVRHLVPED